MIGSLIASAELYGNIGADERMVAGLGDIIKQAERHAMETLDEDEVERVAGIAVKVDDLAIQLEIVCDRPGQERLYDKYTTEAWRSGVRRVRIDDAWRDVSLIAGSEGDVFYLTVRILGVPGYTWELIVPPDGLDGRQSEVYAALRRQNLGTAKAVKAAIAAVA